MNASRLASRSGIAALLTIAFSAMIAMCMVAPANANAMTTITDNVNKVVTYRVDSNETVSASSIDTGRAGWTYEFWAASGNLTISGSLDGSNFRFSPAAGHTIYITGNVKATGDKGIVFDSYVQSSNAGNFGCAGYVYSKSDIRMQGIKYVQKSKTAVHMASYTDVVLGAGGNITIRESNVYVDYAGTASDVKAIYCGKDMYVADSSEVKTPSPNQEEGAACKQDYGIYVDGAFDADCCSFTVGSNYQGMVVGYMEENNGEYFEEVDYETVHVNNVKFDVDMVGAEYQTGIDFNGIADITEGNFVINTPNTQTSDKGIWFAKAKVWDSKFNIHVNGNGSPDDTGSDGYIDALEYYAPSAIVGWVDMYNSDINAIVPGEYAIAIETPFSNFTNCEIVAKATGLHGVGMQVSDTTFERCVTNLTGRDYALYSYNNNPLKIIKGSLKAYAKNANGTRTGTAIRNKGQILINGAKVYAYAKKSSTKYGIISASSSIKISNKAYVKAYAKKYKCLKAKKKVYISSSSKVYRNGSRVKGTKYSF